MLELKDGSIDLLHAAKCQLTEHISWLQLLVFLELGFAFEEEGASKAN